ncbi:hypothetical protein, partial [uncultured Rikenella sp.]|uniref:hypothetical protein n=1 Tax=uncultured Rikenella sp. TaxID=368003 RepID=UPI0026251CF0
FGIAVLGKSDALAARGGRAEDEAHRKEAVLLRPIGSRGPDASHRSARNTPLARRELPFLPGVRPTLVESEY